jgi:hypothetical protein
MDMNAFNISATLNVFKLLAQPSLCLPHATISTFNQLPVPLNKAFGKYKNADIRAVVLDKDNCFAIPHQSTVHKPYEVNLIPFIVIIIIPHGYKAASQTSVCDWNSIHCLQEMYPKVSHKFKHPSNC